MDKLTSNNLIFLYFTALFSGTYFARYFIFDIVYLITFSLIFNVVFGVFSVLGLLKRKQILLIFCLFFFLTGIFFYKPFYEIPEGNCTIVGQINKSSDSSVRLKTVSFLDSGTWYRASGEFYLFLPDNTTVRELDHIALNGINNKNGNLNFIRVFQNTDYFSYPYSTSIITRIKQFFNTYSSDFVKFVKNTIGKETGSIATGTFLGLGMDKETKKIINQSGISYLFVVSGFHFFITFYIFSYLLSFLKIKPKLNAILKIMFLILFYMICATGPSSFRAFLMLFVYQLFKFFDYPVSKLNVIGLSGIIILISDPSIALNAGFQMTFGAVLGILIFSELFKEKPKLLKKFTALGSLLFIIPITALNFRTIPLLSIPVGFFLSFTLIPMIMICMILIIGLYAVNLHFLAAIFLKGLTPLLDFSKSMTEFLSLHYGTIPVDGLFRLILITVFSSTTLFLILIIIKKRKLTERKT
jgi:competence protein ComEC